METGNVQDRINMMTDGDEEEIVRSVSSQNPLLVINAILQGTKRRIQDERYIEGLKSACNNSKIVAGVSVADLATGALDVLEIQKYTGDDEAIKHYTSPEIYDSV